ncbi:amidase [Jatrophihabitans telluris]|uniref:Amidase n=1 Tax=Jatrophihabitans telluris TaxID=2038343 RepID=A0ABY4R319_9ACTN|nr:amidase [Jatrophihabitans telluris]UQX89646.1 amidase [Jatrophihabitans telluris]
MAELHELTALEAAAAVRTRQVGPVELVEHYLNRIERLDEQIGAFTTVTAERARDQARAAERQLAAGVDDLPPLHGVPIAIKDLNLTAGVATKLGSAVFADFVPPIDDTVVELLRQAGTISLGKTATPELGLPCYTETDIGPPVRTPWDPTRLAGGSSGGAAAAVASGFVPIAQGSDGGGSIRIPASVTGLFGLKPARGRISRGPLDAETSGLSVLGPLARTVRDAAAFLDATAVPQPGDPTWAPPLPKGETFLGSCDREPGRLRIGRYIAPPIPGAVVEDECRLAWERAAVLLGELGHEVHEIDLPIPAYTIDAFETVWAVASHGAPIDPAREAELRPLTRYLRERGRGVSGPDYTAALGVLTMVSRQQIQATAGFDAILTPTLAQTPRPVGWFCGTADDPVDPAEDFRRQKMFTPWTAVYNASGQPAASLPLHWTPQGLPVGVMLVGRPAGEAALLALCAQIESVAPWAHRHPPIWEQ